MRGNVRQRANGTRTLTMEMPPDPATGKRRQAYETVQGTKRTALLRVAELQTEVHQATISAPLGRPWATISNRG